MVHADLDATFEDVDREETPKVETVTAANQAAEAQQTPRLNTTFALRFQLSLMFNGYLTENATFKNEHHPKSKICGLLHSISNEAAVVLYHPP